MYDRRETRAVHIGGLRIGGGNPIAIQSMANTDTRDIAATAAQINALAAAGCEIARVAVPDMDAAAAIADIKRLVAIPIVADVHFDHRLALAAIEHGADKLRLNPGNIGGRDKVAAVAAAAKARGIPIRVGVNAGSLSRETLAKHGGATAEALADSALQHAHMLEDAGFTDMVLAVKSSSVPLTIAAYDLLSAQTDYPLHVGITESGLPYEGIIKSAAGIGAILSRGIGDTIRVSLTGDPVEEIRCARAILSAMGLRRFGVEIVSCPTCGRTRINLVQLAQAVADLCKGITAPLKIAVMGCAVNGPGEARDADLGVAGGDGKAVIFRKGQIIATVDEDAILNALKDQLQDLGALPIAIPQKARNGCR